MANGLLLTSLVAKQVNGIRCEGNRSYAKGNYSAAVSSYSRCVIECLKSLNLHAAAGEGAEPDLNGTEKITTLIEPELDDTDKIKILIEAQLDGAKKITASIEPELDDTNKIKTLIETELDDAKKIKKLIEPELDGTKKITKLIAEVRGHDAVDDGQQRNDVLEICNALLLAWSNRAEAFLRLKKYESALADAEKALELEPLNLKSLNRKGKAYEALHRYEEANSCFLAAFKLSPHDEDVREALKRTKICAQQSLRGEFDLSKFYLNRCKGVFHPCCDYVGPVEIRKFTDSRRSLFLAKDVVAGELLLVSNAVAIAPILPEPYITSKGLQFQSKEQEMDHLVTKLAKAAQTCPRAKHQLLTLPHTGTEQDAAIPSMDLFRPGSDWTPTRTENVEPDLRRMCGIAHYSSYNLYTHTADISDSFVTRPLKRTGVWPLPSFLQHSCFPNCLRMHAGTAMFVRAARDMCEGESLTIAWFDVADPLKARQDSCRNWGFLCKCDRCVFEEGLEPLQQMGRRFFELLQLNPQEWTVKLASLVPAVEEIIGSAVEPEQRNWIRASCLYAYIAQADLLRSNLEQRRCFLEAIVESVTSVAPAGMCALEYSAELLRDVERSCGKSSEDYALTEKRVLDVFRIAYGTHSKKALMALVQNFLKSREGFRARQYVRAGF